MKVSKFSIIPALILLLSFAFAVKSSANLPLSDQEPPTYRFLRSWGVEGIRFRDPRGVTFGNDGNIYVVDKALDRIIKIDPILGTVQNIGQLGPSLGELGDPEDIAVDTAHNLYVLDSKKNTIQKFDHAGNAIPNWLQTPIPSDCQWDKIVDGIAINSDNIIHILDRNNDRIIRLTINGVCLSPIGGTGTELGKFINPVALTIDHNDVLYIIDSGNDRVQINAPSAQLLGEKLTQLGYSDYTAQNGNWIAWNITKPFSKIAVDKKDGIYLADRVNNQIKKVNLLGIEPQEESWNPDPQDIQTIQDITTGYTSRGEARLYILDAESFQVKTFAPDGTFKIARGVPSRFYDPGNLAIDSQQNVYIVERLNNRVNKFSPQGISQLSWAIEGCDVEQITQICGIAVDQQDNIYVVETAKSRVSKFHILNDKIIKDSWAIDNLGDGMLFQPTGIAIAQNNMIYIVDIENSKPYIKKYDINGQFILKWQITDNMGISALNPTDIAIDNQNYLYVVDSGKRRILKFQENGEYEHQWGSAQPADQPFKPSQFILPIGIGVDNENNVYVTDWDEFANINANDTNVRHGRIQKFNSDGKYITHWGKTGGSAERFEVPTDVVINNQGYVYVTDEWEHLIQVFRPSSQQPTNNLILNGSFELPISPITTAPDEWYIDHSDSFIERTNYSATDGKLSLQLGDVDISQKKNHSWAHQTVFIPPDWNRPLLAFDYRFFTKHTIDYSDFLVAIQDGTGQNHLATVLHTGWLHPCNRNIGPPASGWDSGWQTAQYDLSEFKDQHIRLNFSNRNLHNDPPSLGIETLVDNVRITNEPLLGSERIYLPVIMQQYVSPCS